MPELLSVREVARLLRLHELTIRRHIRAGKLKAVKVGGRYRVRREDLDRFVVPVPTPDTGARRGKITPGERKAAAQRMLERREKIGPIGIAVADLVKEGRRFGE